MAIPDEVAICNLLYRYAELVDTGQLEVMTEELFAHARFIVGPEASPTLDAQEMLGAFGATTRIYPDGTPKTKHLITNPIVLVDSEGRKATCRSYYTVFQQTDTLPYQPIIAGRYHDRFEKVDGEWRFAERNYVLIDMIGDVSQHLLFDPSTISTINTIRM